MVDRSFGDAFLAELYDALNPWGPGDDFYLDLVMSADSVLDVGCGTGRLLRRARQAGHSGRLTGLDPAAAMLVQGRRGTREVEWVLGDLRCTAWREEFDLVVMTGHAFQELLGDEDVRLSLTAVRESLRPDGEFVFDTRNPGARAWESWTPERIHEVRGPDGDVVRVWHEALTPVRGERVAFTETFDGPRWDVPQVSRSTIRFLGVDTLDRFLGEAGLVVGQRYGDWGRGPFTGASPEIISVVRRTG
ncbi:class I SAM-dependent methyltransferase [Streptomyces sp. TRM72054]|uniref:class I SAM-dependent methyltransferase n=1 Tax=Streptomyces sp. TRM72054 TaxID=2870562 RepID=UPI001C8BDED9|nr:class I SAM-dependent methyltransferase [Streptomyces sp. TRM72054]MBX9393966.1 class I SAM-dependent methyltransferase [Streptomyces sp. TRM72054]